MAHERNMTAEALARGAEPGKGYALARLLSNIFHPVLLSIATFFIAGASPVGGPRGLPWALTCMLIQVVPGLSYYLIRKRQGAFSDEDVSVRQQRNELYLFSFFVLAVGVAVVWLAGAPVVFRALLAGALLLNVLCWAINLRWKISVHAASSASCATIAAMLIPPLGAALWLGAILVGWARVRTHNHTPAQVAAGWALAALMAVATFRAFGVN
jgi:membrane-associated phospholipid phosphatase